jgi:hypothetical protein
MGSDADPNATPARFSWRPVLLTSSVLAVVTFRFLGDGGSGLGWIVGMTLAVVVPSWWWTRSLSLARHRALSQQHPSDDVVEVIGARNLRATLVKSGVLEPDGLRWWNSVTLSAVVTDESLSLWRGGRRPSSAADVPWLQVTDVGLDSASLSSAGPRPVAGVVIRSQWVLNIAPQRRLGSLLAGGDRATELLVILLRAHLEAARSVTRDGVTWTRTPGTGTESLALRTGDVPLPHDAVTDALHAFAAELRRELADTAEVETDDDDDEIDDEIDDDLEIEVVVIRPRRPQALFTGWTNTASGLVVYAGDGAQFGLPRDLGGLETLRATVRAVLDGHVDVGRAPGIAIYRIHLPDGSVREATVRSATAALLAWIWRPRPQWASASPYGTLDEATRE